MMYIDVLDTILWKVWASTENQKDQKQHETALLFLQHASTGIQTRNIIDLRGRYDSARKERFRLSRDDQVIAKAYFSWPPLEESGHMIVSVDRHMRCHQIPRILSSARFPQMGPSITWQASQLIVCKKWLPTWTAYRSLPFQPFPPSAFWDNSCWWSTTCECSTLIVGFKHRPSRHNLQPSHFPLASAWHPCTRPV